MPWVVEGGEEEVEREETLWVSVDVPGRLRAGTLSAAGGEMERA